MDRTKLVSVVVPIYNADSCLNRCVESILLQSYSYFELLLIDDGSTDRSGNICDFYQNKDSRIRVFHQKNAGVSAARNLGIKEACGELLTFVDADDWIREDFLEKMIYGDFELVLCSFASPLKNPEPNFDEEYRGTNNMKQGILKYVHSNIILFTTVWGKLYRTSIIHRNRILFDITVSSGEDTLWLNQYLLYVDSMKISSYVGYMYMNDISHLSLCGISYQSMVHTLMQLKFSYSELEKKFAIDLFDVFSGCIMYFYHRYVLHISILSVIEIRKSLKESCENPILKQMFVDKYIRSIVGRRIVFFNWMATHKMYSILACYIKLQKRYS